MRIQVYKCRFTGKLFEDREKYAQHLLSLRKKMQKERKDEYILGSWKSWLTEERSKITKVNDIPPWFIKNQKKIMEAANAIVFSNKIHNYRRFVDDDEFTELGFNYYRLNKNASNSHVSPDNGVTNFSLKPGLPTGYLGWEGLLSGSLKRPSGRDSTYPYTEALNLVGIKTGTGGGGNLKFRYGFTLFLGDWPGLQEEVKEIEEAEVFSKLKGRKIV